ncbi:hypothetical protein Hanom_Chr17g01558551 [Helianthus anomalus]
MNLFGLNSKGLSQYRGSLCMDEMFIKTFAPFGTMYPPTLHDSFGDRGIKRGSAGCNRNVSLITASRYCNFGRWYSSTMLFRPTTSCNSSCTIFMYFGFCKSSAIIHSTSVDVVSVPPVTMS